MRIAWQKTSDSEKSGLPTSLLDIPCSILDIQSQSCTGPEGGNLPLIGYSCLPACNNENCWVGIRQRYMAELMLIGLPTNRNCQFLAMRPIQLHSPAWLPILREKHILVGPILQAPLFDFSLKASQVLGLRQQGRALTQMLKERYTCRSNTTIGNTASDLVIALSILKTSVA